ncbi:MAG: hypothetical protein HY017_15525 [Betaproteobacteria bacterium]|nr:hypothetical protein [Betaproteobacteria bacterium]
MLERGERLAKLPLPVLETASLANAMRWLTALLILAALAWGVSEGVTRKRKNR